MPSDNQHFVAQLYLRRFKIAESTEEKPRIHTYMKEEGKYLGTKLVSSVASANKFYNVPAKDKQIVDKHLQKLETQVGSILKEVIASESVGSLSYSDLHNLAHYLAAQHYRTMKFREMQTESIKELLDATESDPGHFKDFIKENSRYTVPDIERILSEERIAIASRRLEAQRLPSEERIQRLTALDEELRLLNEGATNVRQFLEDYKQGNVSDEFLNLVKHLVNNPQIKQAQSLQTSVPKLAQRFLDMEWNVHTYSQNAFRFTSDNPLIIFPLAVPASENDWEAHELFSMTWLGMVHFYVDEIIKDYPPMAFILPLTPHVDLSIAPHGQMLTSDELLDQKSASAWNRFQVAQAHRFIFSAQNDFSTVNKAVEDYLWHKRLIEQVIPMRMQEEPHLNKKESHHKRWVKPL